MTSTERYSAPPPTVTPEWSPLGFVPALDGIRAIAVIVVVAYHGQWFGLEGGFIGVDVFFTLSGFLITRLLVDEHHRRGGVSMKNFYMRRALRLLPAVFGLVAGVWLAAALLDVARLDDRLTPRSLWALSYVANWRDVVTGTHSGVFSHLWSLSVEEQFYVVWPVLAVVILQRAGVDALCRVAAGLGIAAGLFTMSRYWTGGSGFDIYFSTHTHGAVLLLAGSWLGASPRLLAAVPRDLARRLLVVGLVGLVVISFAPDRFARLHAGFGYVPIVSLSLVVIIAAVVDDRPSPLTWAPLRRIGKSSYAIYLWHLPMFPVSLAIAPSVDPRIRITIATAIAVILSHWLVERPAMRLKRRWA